MSETVTDMIDELVEAINDEDTERARNLIGAIGDSYGEISTEEEKRIRQASLLRGDGTLSETDKEDLGALVSSAANTEMKRGAFLLRAVTAVREIEQNSTPEDFDNAVSEVKSADEELEVQVENSETIIQESEIPPSVEIVNLGLNPSTIGRNQASRLDVTVVNVGDDPAKNVKITIDPAEGTSISELEETLGTVGSDDDRTRDYDIEVNETGEHRIRVEVVSENAGSDIDSKTLSVEEAEGPIVEDYADQNGIVNLSGLRAAIEDWRETAITDALLEEVTEAWRTQKEVD